MNKKLSFIFWHIYIDFDEVERGKEIVNRQYNKIKDSGLLDYCEKIYVGYISTVSFPFEFIKDSKVEIICQDTFGQEGLTTVALKQFCDALTDEVNILYIHNRGASRLGNNASEDWTLMMEFFLIENWNKAINMLDHYLTAGCEMWEQPDRYDERNKIFHYSGNFWWSRSGYVKKLPYPTFEDRYLQSEMWILQEAGKTIDKTKFGVLHRTSKERYSPGLVDIYVDRYPIKYYALGNETPDLPIDEQNFTFGIWQNTSENLHELSERFLRRASVIRNDVQKQTTQKGYFQMNQLGWFYGVKHDYKEAMYWFELAERQAFKFDESNQWSVFKRILIPVISSSYEEENRTIKKLIGNLDDMLTNMSLRMIYNPNIFDRSFWYAYLDVNPRIILEKYAHLQMRNFSNIVRQEKPKKPTCKRIRLGIVSKSLLPSEKFIGKSTHSSSISDSFYGTFLGLDSTKFDVRFIYVGKSPKVTWDSGHLFLPDITNLQEIRMAQRLIADMELHILVYIDIHIHPMLNYLMFSKLANIQVCTHGHPVTSGIPRDLVDYYISWEAAEILEAQAHYTEKLLLIPKTIVWEYYTPRNTPEQISELTNCAWGHYTRKDLQNQLNHKLIPDKHWYFCAQASFKYHHSFVRIIQEILEQDHEGILIIIKNDKELYNLETQLYECLKKSKQIVRIPKMKHHFLMAMYSHCDVVLDSTFFGGDTTTREAFEVGAPIITLPRRYLGSRWTQAYYTIMGITSLIAQDEKDYVKIALRTIGNNSKLLRNQIREKAKILFHSKHAVKAWEDIFQKIADENRLLIS